MSPSTATVASGSVEEQEELAQVLASRTFAKAPRLCSLLEFVVQRSLEGRHAELTEQQIGIQVFGRAPGYNSSDDTIVRGTARHLRQRLELYYAAEGLHDPLRIDIPRGGYIASFKPTLLAEPLAELPPPTQAPPERFPTGQKAASQPIEKRRPSVPWLIGAIAVLSAALLWLAIAYNNQHRLAARDVAPLQGPQPLWQALFSPDRKTLIIPGDESLDAFVAWEQRSVSLEQYATQLYHRQATVTMPPTHKDVPLSTRSATPMADLALVAMLVRVPEHMGQPRAEQSIEIRYARDLVIADTHDNNLILIGSETFNPWVSLYQPEMDFAAHWDFASDVYRIVNKAPRPGESAVYEYTRGGNVTQKALTHIALLNNSQGMGRVFIIEGTSMGTTYGALNLLTHEPLWAPVMAQAIDRTGRLHDFEVLLSEDLIHGGVGNTHIVAIHVHP